MSSDGGTVLSAGDSRPGAVALGHGAHAQLGHAGRRIKPDVPADPLCRLVSAADSSSPGIRCLEACPNQADMRLTLLTPSGRRTPRRRNSAAASVSVDSDARVVAMTDTTTAVYDADPEPVNVVDDTGTVTASAAAQAVSANAAMSHPGDLVTGGRVIRCCVRRQPAALSTPWRRRVTTRR